MTTLQKLYFVVGAFVAAAGLLKLAQVGLPASWSWFTIYAPLLPVVALDVIDSALPSHRRTP